MTWRMSQKTVAESESIQKKKWFKYFETTLDWFDPLWFGIYSPVLLCIHGKDIISKHAVLKVEKNWRQICADMLRRQE